jgi:integrase
MLDELIRKADRRRAGIVDPFETHEDRPLSQHLDEFSAVLTSKGLTADYVNATKQRIRVIIEGCGFRRIGDISASKVQLQLAALRSNGKSIASMNHYLRAIKMFTRWLVRDRRTSEDRLSHLSKANADVDRRRVRRPLSMDEFGRLLEAAESGPMLEEVSGPDRAVLYIVAAYTGFRRNEIGSITLASFDFISIPPTLTVNAAYSKHRKTDVLPLGREIAERIRTWIASRTDLRDDQPLFDVSDKRTAEMIKADLTAARRKWIDEAGADADERRRREQSSFLADKCADGRVVDFHALRKTFVTNLARAGVTPNAAQTLARHGDINLTMNTYTSLELGEQFAALELLPPIPEVYVGVQPDLATANKNLVPPAVPTGAQTGALQPALAGLLAALTCTKSESGTDTDRLKNRAKIVGCCGELRRPASQCESRDLNPDGLPHWILSPKGHCSAAANGIWSQRAAARIPGRSAKAVSS